MGRQITAAEKRPMVSGSLVETRRERSSTIGKRKV
jgi:hypothetical protein